MLVIPALFSTGMGRIHVLLAECPQRRHSSHGIKVHTHLEGGGAPLVVDQCARGIVRTIRVILTMSRLVNVVIIYKVILLLVSILVIGRGWAIIHVIATGFAVARFLIRLILVRAVIGVLTTRSAIRTRFFTRFFI